MLELKSVDLTKTTIETLAIPVCKDREIHNIKSIQSLVKKAKELHEFAGDKDDAAIFYNPAGVKAKRVIFLGLGKFKEIDLETIRAFSGRAVRKCIKKKLSKILIAVPLGKNIEKKINLNERSVLEAMIEGACLGNHIFDKYKTEKKHKKLTKIDILVTPGIKKKYIDLPLRIETVCSGTILARDWVSTPSNDKQPEIFTKSIEKHAKKENLNIKVLDEKELKQEKLNAMLAVAAGSKSKPKLIILNYSPEGAKKTIVLVGKGVTFDSGGINLKPAGSLEDMKMDMSGAAAVAGALITTAKLKPKTKVVGVIPVVENMPSGDASRPGDIITSYNGKTVEIGNTDAEGRLILIDAISYSIKEYKPDILIDIATLTGACVVALGEKIAGIFSSDDNLARSIVESGEKTHERCWHMPLPDDYKELLKSEFADIQNISSSRWGGAITGALFLSEFAKGTRWAHIDIAGPAYIKKENAYCGAGGTGFGVRLLCDLLENL